MRQKISGLLLVLLLFSLLDGCSAVQLEERNFPMLAAVDEQGGKVTFAYGFPADSCIILAFFFIILHEATPYRTLPKRKHGEEDRTNR